jgi:hypothetical protein
MEITIFASFQRAYFQHQSGPLVEQFQDFVVNGVNRLPEFFQGALFWQ